MNSTSMKQSFTNGVRSLFLARDLFLSRTIDPRKLVPFFEAVKPIKIQTELIRIGGEGDGGYLIPNDFENLQVCFSPGVDVCADFEESLTRMGIKCFLADYSVDAPPIQNPLFDFEKRYLGPRNDEVFITLDSWIERKAPGETDFILQMDIEGAEYSVLLDASPQTLRKFRILVIEFHALDTLLLPGAFDLIDSTFSKLLRDFSIVHIHPNNACGVVQYRKFTIPKIMEFTFLRNDRIDKADGQLSFPHKLDRPNKPEKSDIVLPQCWYDN